MANFLRWRSTIYLVVGLLIGLAVGLGVSSYHVSSIPVRDITMTIIGSGKYGPTDFAGRIRIIPVISCSDLVGHQYWSLLDYPPYNDPMLFASNESMHLGRMQVGIYEIRITSGSVTDTYDWILYENDNYQTFYTGHFTVTVNVGCPCL